MDSQLHLTSRPANGLTRGLTRGLTHSDVFPVPSQLNVCHGPLDFNDTVKINVLTVDVGGGVTEVKRMGIH